MSLLKRIEQGGQQGQQGTTAPQPSSGGSQGNSGDSSRLSSLQARRVSAPITSPQAGSYFDLKTRVQNKLLAELDPSMDITKTDEVRKTIQGLFEQILTEENIVLSRPERARLFEQIAAEILGLGPLQPLLEDDTITEIMVNGAKNIYVERRGKLQKVPLSFENNEHVMRIIERIVAPLGRRIDRSQPLVDARLRDAFAAVEPRKLTARERQEYLALLSRWYYSSWCDGEFLRFESFEDIPYRKLVHAINRVARAGQ